MKYRYQCTSDKCEALNERVQSIHDEIPTSVTCSFCGDIASKVIEAPAVMTGNMSNKPFDVAVGRDAAARWDNIHARQEQRDKVRRDANQVGLTATSYNTFKPISDDQRKRRASGMRAVEKDGFKGAPNSAQELARTTSQT
jgi:hypothetical protein